MASGSVPSMMDTSAGPATPTRRPAEAPTGASPPAKRPVALVVAQGVAGAAEAGLMDQTQISMAIRDLQQKFASIESWAVTVNDSVTDHAGHIDHQKARIESFALHGRTVTTKISETTADVKEFARQAVENDSAAKAAIASVVELLGNEVEKLKQYTRDAGLALENRVNLLEGKARDTPGGQAQAGSSKVDEVEATMIRRTELLREQSATIAAKVEKLEAHVAASQQQQQQQQQQMPQQPDPMAGGNDAWSHARSHTQHFDVHSNGGHGGHGGWGGQTGGPGTTGGMGFSGDTGGQQGVSIKVTMDLKIAQLPKHQYNEAHPEAWHKEIRKYLIGRHVDMQAYLNWIETEPRG